MKSCPWKTKEIILLWFGDLCIRYGIYECKLIRKYHAVLIQPRNGEDIMPEKKEKFFFFFFIQKYNAG